MVDTFILSAFLNADANRILDCLNSFQAAPIGDVAKNVIEAPNTSEWFELCNKRRTQYQDPSEMLADIFIRSMLPYSQLGPFLNSFLEAALTPKNTKLYKKIHKLQKIVRPYHVLSLCHETFEANISFLTDERRRLEKEKLPLEEKRTELIYRINHIRKGHAQQFNRSNESQLDHSYPQNVRSERARSSAPPSVLAGSHGTRTHDITQDDTPRRRRHHRRREESPAPKPRAPRSKGFFGIRRAFQELTSPRP